MYLFYFFNSTNQDRQEWINQKHCAKIRFALSTIQEQGSEHDQIYVSGLHRHVQGPHSIHQSNGVEIRPVPEMRADRGLPRSGSFR